MIDIERSFNFSEFSLSNAEGILLFDAIMACPYPQIIASKRLKVSDSYKPIKASSLTKIISEDDFSNKVKQIWMDLLGVKEISPHDDFFILGGDSLTAIQLNYKIKNILSIDLSPDILLEYSKFQDFIAKIKV